MLKIRMIRLNVFFRVESEENRALFIEKATELVNLSRKEEGCVAYDVFASLTENKHLMICETWRSEDDLEKHSASEHFRRLVPQLHELGESKAEKFKF